MSPILSTSVISWCSYFQYWREKDKFILGVKQCS